MNEYTSTFAIRRQQQLADGAQSDARVFEFTLDHSAYLFFQGFAHALSMILFTALFRHFSGCLRKTYENIRPDIGKHSVRSSSGTEGPARLSFVIDQRLARRR